MMFMRKPLVLLNNKVGKYKVYEKLPISLKYPIELSMQVKSEVTFLKFWLIIRYCYIRGVSKISSNPGN